MRIGTFLPHMGDFASPEALVKAARHAELLDYDSVWVAERVLYPVNPRTPYGGTPDGSLPEYYQRVFTPTETLTWVAAHTERIRVGTSVFNMPMHNPVVLARELTTLDVLSGGRLNVGLGQGWSQDEYEATGAATNRIGARADEFIGVLKAMWGPDPVSYDGEFFKVAPSIIQPKPAQQPPIYLAAYAPSSLSRVARLADGWLPTGIPLAAVGEMSGQLRQMAADAGRDPSRIQIIVLGHTMLTDQPQGAGRFDFIGNVDEIRRDVDKARELGASEVILSPGTAGGVTTLDGFLSTMETLRTTI